MNTHIQMSRHYFLLIVSLVLVGCSSTQKLQQIMTKDDIIDYYLEIFSANTFLSGKYSEYTYHYIDTVVIREHFRDSLYYEDVYKQLSAIRFFPNSQQSPFMPDHLPPYVIEKNGILFLPLDEKWGPNHPEVEKALNERGHYFTYDDLEYLELFHRHWFSEFEKGTYYFFTRDNPKKYQVVRTWKGLKCQQLTKFKGACSHREIIVGHN